MKNQIKQIKTKITELNRKIYVADTLMNNISRQLSAVKPTGSNPQAAYSQRLMSFVVNIKAVNLPDWVDQRYRDAYLVAIFV